MGEGLTVLASSLNTVRTMATRDIYETGFDEFKRRNGNLIAKFDDSLGVYSSVRKYARTLPSEARATQDGNHIQIKADETLQNGFPFNINQNKGLLSRIAQLG